MKNIFLVVACFLPTSFYAMNDHQNLEQWKIKHRIQYDEAITKTDFNAANNTLLVHGKTKTELINLPGGKSQRLNHTNNCWQPSFSPTGNYIITSPKPQAIRLLAPRGAQAHSFKCNDHSSNVVFNHEESQLLAVDSGFTKRIQIWDLEGRQVAQCEPGYCIKVCKFFPHDERLVFIAHSAYSCAKIWDVRTKKPIAIDYVNTLDKASIHKDGHYIACIPNKERVVQIFDIRNGKKLDQLECGRSQSAKFNSSGTHILTYFFDNIPPALLALSALLAAQQANKDFLNLNTKNVISSQFHPTGTRALTTSIVSNSMMPNENNIAIWDLNGNLVGKINHNEQFRSAKFDRSGEYITTRSISPRKSPVVLIWEKE